MNWIRCALGALIMLFVLTPPASSQRQGNTLDGRWQCSLGVQDPRRRLTTVMTRYILMLYPNGTFSAQGVTQGGVVTERFQASGRWGLSQKDKKYFVTARGQQTILYPNGQRAQRSFTNYGQVYSLNSFGIRTQTQSGSTVALSCQRT